MLSPIYHDTGQGLVECLIKDVDELTSRFTIEEKLSDYGINEEDIDRIIDNSTGSSMSGNPVDLSREEKTLIVQSVL